jgi:glycosyltransferase involved in cell wall biosynthesis
MSETGRSRVLVLTSTFPRRRDDVIPPFVLRLCQALGQDSGWESLVLAPHASGLPTSEVIEGVACRRFRYAPAALEQLAYGGGMLANVRAARWRWLLVAPFLLALFLHACRVLADGRIRVVHAHWIIPQGVVAVLLKRVFWWRRLRVVLTAHGGDLHADMGQLARRVLVAVMRQADVLAVVSQAMREQAINLGMPGERIVVAPMGVDVERFRPPDAGRARAGLLFVGRLAEKKGVIHLVHAFRALHEQMPRVQLDIVGDGPLRAGLEAEVLRLGLADAVVFHGALPQAEIPPFFQQAQVFVMPSVVADSGDQEGLGLVAAEALACGCPVVAHDLPAIRDIVLDNVTGLMVPPGDEAALAAAIMRLLQAPDLAAGLAEAGRQHVRQQYGWPAVARRYRTLYAGQSSVAL